MDAALIAHHLPGLGDPMRLNIVQFNGYLERLDAVVNRDKMSNRELVEMEAGVGSSA